MTVGRCGECRFWGGPDSWQDRLPLKYRGWGKCRAIDEDANPFARSQDMEGLSWFETRSDFGCTLWEARP